MCVCVTVCAWCVCGWAQGALWALLSQQTISSTVAVTRARWVRVCCWHCATGAAWPLPTTPPRPCHAVAATVSATTVKSQLAHSPPPDLPPRSHLPSRSVYDIAISRYELLQ